MDVTALRRGCALSAWTGEPGRCQWCDTGLADRARRTVYCSDACRRAFERNHVWRRARAAARRRARYRCARPGCPGDRATLEVNHIAPLAGTGHGYGVGCAHHLDGLEVLCHDHHVEVTRQQRAARAAG